MSSVDERVRNAVIEGIKMADNDAHAVGASKSADWYRADAVLFCLQEDGYSIVPTDPQTWETVEPSPRIVACPLCGGHVELEDAAGVDEHVLVVSSIDREGRAL